jgi:hypothetical protein
MLPDNYMALCESRINGPEPGDKIKLFWDRSYINASTPLGCGPGNSVSPTNNLWGHKKEYEIPEELGFQEPSNKDQFLLFPE